MANSRKIWLTPHGASDFSLAGRVGGDSRLCGEGEEYARRLPEVVVDRLPLVSSLFPKASATPHDSESIKEHRYQIADKGFHMQLLCVPLCFHVCGRKQ